MFFFVFLREVLFYEYYFSIVVILQKMGHTLRLGVLVFFVWFNGLILYTKVLKFFYIQNSIHCKSKH
jgi:hypothetical protein